MNKLVIGVASLAILAAGLAASAQSHGHGRDAGDYGHGGYDRGGAYGGALAAGVAGLVIGSALAGPGDYGYAPSYGYPPAYGYGYAPRCVWRTEPYRTYYGGVAYRRVEVCR